MMEDQSQPRSVFVAEFVKRAGHCAARGTLKVAEFLDGHGCVRFAANMDAAGRTGCRGRRRDLLRPVKRVTAAERNQRDHDHDKKRQEPFHELESKGKRLARDCQKYCGTGSIGTAAGFRPLLLNDQNVMQETGTSAAA
jgi:hypothetical protein